MTQASAAARQPVDATPRLTYALDEGNDPRFAMDCPLAGGHAARVDRHGERVSVRCLGGCDDGDVKRAFAPLRDTVLAELKAGIQSRDPVPGRYDGRVLNVADLLAQPDEPLPWRCSGVAADGYLTTVAGRGGEGKSWLALSLACGVARGKAVAGIDCAEGRALIFDAENGPKLIARRFRAARVNEDLAVQPVDAGGLRFGEDDQWFRSVIESQKANFVVFDSLRVLSSGAKESDGDEMEPKITVLKQLARDTGAAIVLVHHRGKSDLSDFRGSSVILDQTDLLFTFSRMAGDPDGRRRRKLSTVKCRVDEEPEPRWIQIVADADQGLVTLAEAEPYEGGSGSPTPGRDALRESVLSTLTGISQSATRIAKAVGRSPKDGTVRRLLRDLEAEGLAENRADGWGVPSSAPKGDGGAGTPVETLTVEPKAGVPEGVPASGPYDPWETA